MIRIILLVLVVCSLAAWVYAHPRHHANSMLRPAASLSAWNWEPDSASASASLAIDHETLTCGISQTNGSASTIRLFQLPSGFQEGHSYRITFQAKADCRRLLTIRAGSALPSDRANPWLDTTFEISREWKSCEFVFEAHNVQHGPFLVPEFQLGAATGTVTMKDIVLQEIN